MRHRYPRVSLRRGYSLGASRIVRRFMNDSGTYPTVLYHEIHGTSLTKQNRQSHSLYQKQRYMPQFFLPHNCMRFLSSSSSFHHANPNSDHVPNRIRPNQQPPHSTMYHDDEIQKFSRMSHQWWDTKQNPLISMNPIRIRFIQDCVQQYYLGNNNQYKDDNNSSSDTSHLTPKIAQDYSVPLSSSSSSNRDVSKLKILDIGCGGGLLCESLIRLNMGQIVVGLDPSTSLIQMAQYHAQTTLSTHQFTRLQYYNTTVQDYYSNIIHKTTSTSKPSSTSTPDVPSTSNEIDTDGDDNKFDIICCLEVLEHVSNDQRQDMLQVACQHLLRTNGLLFISTINPTIKSFFVTILGAEYITKILPINTHNWHQFLSPTMIRDDLVSLSKSFTTGTRVETEPVPWRMMERSVTGMVIPIPSIPATILFNQWDWRLDPNDTDVNWIGCYQKSNSLYKDTN
jgi:2-polyprenyl-3-methyl-5-hydroxy-6-metoxy-1,4-benzoquinol methylase